MARIVRTENNYSSSASKVRERTTSRSALNKPVVQNLLDAFNSITTQLQAQTPAEDETTNFTKETKSSILRLSSESKKLKLNNEKLTRPTSTSLIYSEPVSDQLISIVQEDGNTIKLGSLSFKDVR